MASDGLYFFREALRDNPKLVERAFERVEIQSGGRFHIPLWPAIGIIDPEFGQSPTLEVGNPSASVSQVEGMACPTAFIPKILPAATALDAISRRRGCSLPAGTAYATGLFPMTCTASTGDHHVRVRITHRDPDHVMAHGHVVSGRTKMTAIPNSYP